jgi:hypothetical protein
MSLQFAGNAFIAKLANLPTSTGAMTHTWWMKRTTTPTDRRYFGTIRVQNESTGHQIWFNEPVGSQQLSTQANYGRLRKPSLAVPVLIVCYGATIFPT